MTVVDELRPPAVHPWLEMSQIALQRQILQSTVSHDQRQRSRDLVDLPALDTNTAVLDHVDPAEPVAPAERVHRPDQLCERGRFAVDRDGDALVEPEHDLRRFGWTRARRRRPLEGLLRRRHPLVLQRAALGGSTPQVLVDGEAR